MAADERWAFVSLQAAALAGGAAIVASLAGLLWEVAHGQRGSDFLVVAVVGGLTYVVALLWYRR